MDLVGPSLQIAPVLVASASADLIADSRWVYRRLPFNAMISVALNTTGAARSVLWTFLVGSDTQVGPENIVPAGGVAGVLPDRDFQSLFLGAAGDILSLTVRETAAAAPTVNLLIDLQPV